MGETLWGDMGQGDIGSTRGDSGRDIRGTLGGTLRGTLGGEVRGNTWRGNLRGSSQHDQGPWARKLGRKVPTSVR